MNSQDDMSEMFDSIPGITILQRESAKARYRFLLAEYRYRSWLYAILFYTLRITMTVGSLTVPALLSIKVDGATGETALYWTTWAISLAVTTSNGLMTLFKLDKRFFMLHGVAERLRTETWQFLTLAGRYSGHYNSNEEPSHANQYVHYCTNIEKIRMRHMDDEYISVGEADTKVKAVQNAAAATATTTSNPIATGSTIATTQPPSVSQAVPRVAVPPPMLPPAGTMIPNFLSPTSSSNVPTPPRVLSRHTSFAQPQSQLESPITPPLVGIQITDAAPQTNTTEESSSALSVSRRDGDSM